MIQFSVDDKRCIRCGLCVSDCPSRIIEREGDAVPRVRPEQEALCIQCQHCLAVCPEAAVSVLGRKPEDSLPLTADTFPKLDQMLRFVRGRRSIRHYRDENVDPARIRQLLAALGNVPTGVNRRELTFSVIDDKAAMQRLREKVLAALADATKANRIPERFVYLTQAAPAYYDRGIDIIFRTAPHALIISAPPDAPCPQQDVALALAYFELLAQSAGLGTVWWGMLSMVLALMPEFKPLLGLERKDVFYGMLFGIPSIRFPRAVQRDDGAKVRQLNL